MKTFIASQFGYCHLVWMFHDRMVNKKTLTCMKGPHGLFIKGYIGSFEDLLKRERSVTIHFRNIQSLAKELPKVKQNFSNSMLWTIFQTQSISYNLGSQTDFTRSNASTRQYGLNSIRCFAFKVGHMIPLEIKNSVSIESFEEKIRMWKASSCNCKFC